jgi:DNA-binding LacI/PurR family transcriptional regulator
MPKKNAPAILGFEVRVIAAAAETTPKSVRNCLSNPKNMKPILRARIERVLREKGYLRTAVAP